MAPFTKEQLAAIIANYRGGVNTDPSTVSVTGIEGIGGGGFLNVSRTLYLDIPSLTAEATVDPANDYFVIYDDDAGAHKKVLGSNLPSSIGGETNTASNIGAGGVGVFDGKVGVDLQFRNINSDTATTGISITDDSANDEIDVSLAIDSLTQITTASLDTALDLFVVYDDSAGDYKSIDIDEITSLASDKHYTHTQGVASAIWSITHGLNKYPSVHILDSAGDEVEAHINHVDLNNTIITFSSANSGKAIFN